MIDVARPKWFPLAGTPFAVRADVLSDPKAMIQFAQSLAYLADTGGLNAAQVYDLLHAYVPPQDPELLRAVESAATHLLALLRGLSMEPEPCAWEVETWSGEGAVRHLYHDKSIALAHAHKGATITAVHRRVTR
jgi:hypothetical protein